MNPAFRTIEILLATCLLFVAACLQAAQARSGDIEGAPYAVWRPAEANGILLLRAPGYRPMDAPRGIVWEASEDPVYAALIDDGWTVAMTRYRRNGWVIDDGVTDVAALIENLSAAYGPFRIVIVEGESMGGLIVTRLVEDPARSGLVSGAVAFGAALAVPGDRLTELGGDPADLRLTHAPTRPLYFVSNRNELAGPLAYLARAAMEETHMRVAVHSLERPGHVNLADEERSLALLRIYNWVSGEPPARLDDASVDVPQAVGSGRLGDDAIAAEVTLVDPNYGNIDLNVTLADLRQYGADFGDSIGIRKGEQTHFARIGDRYASVPAGQWVAVVLPDGQLRLAINMGHAASALGVEPGSELLLLPAQ